jgi:hypothetical protein
LSAIFNQSGSEPDLSSASLASVPEETPVNALHGTPDPDGEAPIPSPTISTPAPSINVRIPTGPLIYRGATPLGGILAAGATRLDPTPAIDRLDGALAAYLDGLIDEGELLSARERLEAGYEAVTDIRGIERSREDSTVAGTTPGNLPLVASRLMESPDADQATAFLASLPSPTVESPILDPIAMPLAIDVVSTNTPEETRFRESAASWASTAVGLTLGLTLTSGPYFPDLLARARKMSPRRFRRSTRRRDDDRQSPR